MGYLSLYRKWRPKGFADLTGQPTVVKTLKNAITINRIAHAYLFCGPRGTGKTSTAKVFAKALNCSDRTGTEPCNRCFSCEQINSGRSVDVIEMDAASNRRIDEIRDLREKVKFSPSEGDYKVYIIDEVHMLTKEAFNALLKTLEEPPANVVFILATTEPHKVLPTIISRCQRFDFGLLSMGELKDRMRYICEQEGVEADERALHQIARTAEGGMRDALSILDQAISFGGSRVVLEDVNSILGKVDQQILSGIADVMVSHDSRGALRLVNTIVDQGKDMNQFVKDLLFHFRDLMLLKECGPQNMLTDLPADARDELTVQAGRFSTGELLRILELLSETDQQLRFTSQPRLALEMLMIKLTSREADLSLHHLINRVSRVEEIIGQGPYTGAVGGAGERPPAPGESRTPGTPEAGTETGSVQRSGSGPEARPVIEPGRVPAVDAPETAAEQDGSDRGAPLSNPLLTELPPADSLPDDIPVISAEETESYWTSTMTLLQNSAQTRKLRAFLIVAKPYRVIGDTLYVVYPQTSTFHKSSAEKELNLLERALKKVTGYPVKARLIFEGEEQGLQQSMVPAERTVEEGLTSITPPPTANTLQQDPIVQKALKIFGGKVIQLENE